MTKATQLKRISHADMKTRIEYHALLPAQRKYVDALLETGESSGTYNFLAATAVAYPSCARNPRSLLVRSSQMQSHPKVRQVLNLAFGQPQVEDADVLVTLKVALKKSIRKDIAERGVLSDATAKALQVWEHKTGKKLVTYGE
jgi:hypothetical protein